MPELTAIGWVLVLLAAAFAGFSKTAIGGAGAVAAAMFALALPARESTGALLPLLICGDVIAVARYRREANWRLIVRLMPWMLAGIGLGVGFLALVRGNQAVKVTIGGLILVVLGTHLLVGGRLRRTLAGTGSEVTGRHRLAAGLAGTAAGFTTMVANAAGSVMTVYLLLSGVTVLEFLGTGAWFFAIVNVIKLPFSVQLGLIQPGSLLLDAALLPALAIGAGLGIALVNRIERQQFERAALTMAAVSAAFLLI